ncbi:hypothetical protein AB0H07_39005 [Streptomyces sp. NPDC021354]|uniref:hypothetical protein n=1 Tax=Streptomyces sp. NPDC021354 TaxID=3154793 RepID=UPI00340CF4C2
MARYTSTIDPVHADGTVCSHRRTSTGKPTQPGCSGRHEFIATCTGNGCTWKKTDPQKTVLEVLRDQHLRSHVTMPAPTTC